MTRRLLVLGAIACLILAGCGPTEPIRLGFIGGLSDRNSDNGQSGQNGVILAIEQFNRAGGLHGRMVELVSRDDAQHRETAARSAHELVAARVEAVIGPFTSSMAEVIVPITGQAGILGSQPDHHLDGLLRQGRQSRAHQPDNPRQRRGITPRP